MPHALTLGDPGHPEHYRTCEMCSSLPSETEISIIPLAHTESCLRDNHLSRDYRPPHMLEPCPSGDTFRERIDSILGELFQLDATAQSLLGDGWEWEIGEKLGFPAICLTVDRVKEPVIRFQIEKILRRMNLRSI